MTHAFKFLRSKYNAENTFSSDFPRLHALYINAQFKHILIGYIYI